MKSTDDIKEGLDHCAHDTECKGCPYNSDCFMADGSTVIAHDALEYIHQLENQLADAGKKVAQLEAAQLKWISVEERLPEKHGQPCVCLFNQHGADKSILFPLVFTWYAYGHNGYINGPHFNDEGLDGLKVHFWMPLPEPPKE